jgi:hypothetical protein
MLRTDANRNAPTAKPNCHQNCHSRNLEWWIVRDNTNAPISPMELTQEFLRSRTRFYPKTGCWEYLGARDANGYGRVFVAGKERKAPRVFFEVFVGPLPKGARLKHPLSPENCIGSSCCNPAHLKLEQTFNDIKFARRICPKGHLIDAENAVIENRGENLLVRCRACRQLEWRTLKRRKKQNQGRPQPPSAD